MPEMDGFEATKMIRLCLGCATNNYCSLQQVLCMVIKINA